ncbi:M23 family metallopeptidase [Solicola gregarius]|uniref:M23 family metallopeptidase n=1 Tax=Solicola gregarius TaxID=2908642 RepID=A0AA46TEX3_9ACTN|nr:M23 family metallopeptidase [Solicola gregarius]UYM03890.1 M23 family metallopeptidase [Solicola gregarius]
MPSRRAPKRKAAPSRASRTSHRAPKPTGGKRAYKQRSHAAPTAKKRTLPAFSMPIAAGATALVIAGVGAVTLGPATGSDSDSGRQYPALSGDVAAAGSLTSRDPNVGAFDPSRDADRELLEEQAEQQAVQRRQALQELAAKTQQQAKKLKATQWVLPLAGYRITATFGEAGPYWSSGYHTGLDFAAASGTPLVAVAHGTITDTAYDPAYGNRTILTLDDGTELWYCHQTDQSVEVGDTVDPGDPMGTVGSTGNVTGPHLHLEVHPGGSDDGVDPYTVLEEHGVTP